MFQAGSTSDTFQQSTCCGKDQRHLSFSLHFNFEQRFWISILCSSSNRHKPKRTWGRIAILNSKIFKLLCAFLSVIVCSLTEKITKDWNPSMGMTFIGNQATHWIMALKRILFIDHWEMLSLGWQEMKNSSGKEGRKEKSMEREKEIAHGLRTWTRVIALTISTSACNRDQVLV